MSPRATKAELLAEIERLQRRVQSLDGEQARREAREAEVAATSEIRTWPDITT